MKPGKVVHADNLSIWEVHVGGSEVLDQLGLYSETWFKK
jgi:hypothetical protein